MSDFIKAKVAFGELTLGEVHDLVQSRCSHIDVYENDVWRDTYSVFSKDEKGLYLFEDEHADQADYSFDASAKVKVKDDGVEFKWKGTVMSLKFLESRAIRLSSILPRRS